MRKAIVIGLVAILIGSIGIGMIGGDRNTHMANIEERGYTPHDPIVIHGNSELDSKHGVVGGNGTKDNPYIISGWEIKGENEGLVTHGIAIFDTDAYVVIEYCYIYNETDGIYLDNVSYLTITHNKIWHNGYGNWRGEGIFIGGNCFNITIEYNIISSNRCGVNAYPEYIGWLSGPLEVHYNDFINNTCNAHDSYHKLENEMNPHWDHNYWSDYNGTDSDGDGYGDTPYKGSGFVDHHPLMHPVNPAVEKENSSPLTSGVFLWLWVILGIVIVAAIVIAIVFGRRRR